MKGACMVLEQQISYVCCKCRMHALVCLNWSGLWALSNIFFLVEVTFSSMPSAGASHDFPENQVRGAATKFHWSEDF